MILVNNNLSAKKAPDLDEVKAEFEKEVAFLKQQTHLKNELEVEYVYDQDDKGNYYVVSFRFVWKARGVV